MLIDTDRVCRLGDIAKMAAVSPSAVSNWRKRHADFPQPIVTIDGWGSRGRGLELFEKEAVEEWLVAREDDLVERLEAREAKLKSELAAIRRRRQEITP